MTDRQIGLGLVAVGICILVGTIGYWLLGLIDILQGPDGYMINGSEEAGHAYEVEKFWAVSWIFIFPLTLGAILVGVGLFGLWQLRRDRPPSAAPHLM